MKDTVSGIDDFQLTDDEATELTIHHLRLAAKFFMSTPDDGGIALQEEIIRQIEKRSVFGPDEVEANAARKFLALMIDYHEAAKHGEGTPQLRKLVDCFLHGAALYEKATD